MPKLEYPATFSNGLAGMKCLETIQNREAIIAVPYKMIFSVNKVKNNPKLQKILL